MSSLMIPDAFLLQLAIVDRTTNYANLALRQMSDLRQSTLFRGRAIVAPDAGELPLPAYETYKIQVRVIPNSYVWGISWGEFTDQATTGNDVAIQITDTCTGLDFFSDFQLGVPFFHSFVGGGIRPGSSIPQLLSKPKLIQAPGLIDIQISNRTTAGISGQLTLFVAEPAIRENVQALAKSRSTISSQGTGYTSNANQAVNTPGSGS